MAEYSNAEKPFLDKLRQAHWDVIDQGQGVPLDTGKSLHTSFNEVALRSLKQLTSMDLLQADRWPDRLYLEGNSDFDLLREWALVLNHPSSDFFQKKLIQKCAGQKLW
jgi:hypothetical protein